ncbi:MAG: hypothetical protein PHG14_02850 [Desulfobacter postgatei]|uniref:hypothetical protein n=1 Tax=Desulfobacter postgatei TaxID=2293 RepID=UPI0023F1544D|nr:hypothetical protein [Desulfobacter postgatei]MDD4272645.1 hypothetical protein [Desulfobacter postgatei]
MVGRLPPLDLHGPLFRHHQVTALLGQAEDPPVPEVTDFEAAVFGPGWKKVDNGGAGRTGADIGAVLDIYIPDDPSAIEPDLIAGHLKPADGPTAMPEKKAGIGVLIHLDNPRRRPTTPDIRE